MSDLNIPGPGGQAPPGDPDSRIWLPADKILIVILLFFILSLAALFSSHLARDLGYHGWGHRAAWVGWGGCISILFFIFFSLTVKALESICIHRFYPGPPPLVDARAGSQGTIRAGRYLPWGIIAGLLAVCVSLSVQGVIQALALPRKKQVLIKIHNLPPELEGFRIVQLTDLHISLSTANNRVKKIVDRVNGLAPDIIALTGDITDGPHKEIRDEAAPLAGLTSRLGNFFVTGNHEYFHDADDWNREMTRLGFTVLSNEHRLIRLGNARLLIGGIPDSRGDPGRPDPEKAAGKKEDGMVKILLAHRPGIAYEASAAGFDLQLSGHTHGGQIGLIALLRGILQPFQSGLYAFEKMMIYVSNGAGYWGVPLRFGAPSEISLIELTGVKKGSPAMRVDPKKIRMIGGW